MSEWSFTWGTEVAELGFVQVYNFMLRTYAKLGVTVQEMMCLMHLASYHYNSPQGVSRPSLSTIAEEMGYSDKSTVSRLVGSLEKKGMLIVTRNPGYTSLYDASPFASLAIDEWNGRRSVDLQATGGVDLQINRGVDPQINRGVDLQINRVLICRSTEEDEIRRPNEEHETKNTTVQRRVAPLEAQSASADNESQESQKPATKQARPPGLTEGQKFWLDAFGAKRFANNIQNDAVQNLERTYGTKTFKEGVTWAAKRGLSMGQALTSLETALPKWGKKGNHDGNSGSSDRSAYGASAKTYTVQGWEHRGCTPEEFYTPEQLRDLGLA